MLKNKPAGRRNFLKETGGSTLAGAAAPFAGLALEEKINARTLQHEKMISFNDTIRIRVVDPGTIDCKNLYTALKVPGVEPAAACGRYTGRLEREKERHGKDFL